MNIRINWLAWYNCGRAYTGLGLYEKALDAFEFTMAIQEDFDLVYRDAADIYYRLEKFEQAIRTFETAQEKSGGFEDYSFRIGLCYERLGDLKKARFHYRKATRQDPYFDESFFRIAETYRLEERYEPALVNYKKALRIDEENELYMACIISVYRMLSRDQEVLQYLQRLVAARPDILNYWLDLIAFRYEQNMLEEGLEDIARATERCGHFVEFLYLNSLFLWKSGRTREAYHMLTQALQEDFPRHTILRETDKSYLLQPEVIRLMDLHR
jgi:tetratricopeptide (TPR) repeat protein